MGAIVVGAVAAIIFQFRTRMREDRQRQEAEAQRQRDEAQRQRDEDQKKFVELQSSADRLCEMR